MGDPNLAIALESIHNAGGDFAVVEACVPGEHSLGNAYSTFHEPSALMWMRRKRPVIDLRLILQIMFQSACVPSSKLRPLVEVRAAALGFEAARKLY